MSDATNEVDDVTEAKEDDLASEYAEKLESISKIRGSLEQLLADLNKHDESLKSGFSSIQDRIDKQREVISKWESDNAPKPSKVDTAPNEIQSNDPKEEAEDVTPLIPAMEIKLDPVPDIQPLEELDLPQEREPIVIPPFQRSEVDFAFLTEQLEKAQEEKEEELPGFEPPSLDTEMKEEPKTPKRSKSPKTPKSRKSRKSRKSIKSPKTPRKSTKLKKMKSIEKEDDDRPRDHQWLFTKLLHLRVHALDIDRSGDVDREEFLQYFVDRLDCPRVISELVFDDIDLDKGGTITTDELLRWKNKHSKPEQLIPFFPPGYLERLEQERVEKLYENHLVKVRSLSPEEAAHLHLQMAEDLKAAE